MKRISRICLLTACLSLLLGLTAWADDGAALYRRHCAGCHGANGEKGTGGTQAILGKDAATIQRMLEGYKAGTYGGAQKGMMQKIVNKLSQEEIKDVSSFVGSLK